MDEQIIGLLEIVKKYGLSRPKWFAWLTEEGLAAAYNGVGPDSFPAWLRKLVTGYLVRMEPLAFIHDQEWKYSPRTYLAFTVSQLRWAVNAFRLLRCYHSSRKRFIAVAIVCALACQLFGWREYRDAAPGKIKNIRRKMKKSLLLLLMLLVAGLLTGCRTTSTIQEFDQEGRLVKTTVTERDPFDKVTDSVKDKTVVMWSNGWAAYVSVSTATTEDPTPTGKIFAGKVSRGYISMLEKQKNAEKIPAIIAATREDLSVTAEGVKSTAGTAVTATPDLGAATEPHANE